MNASPAFQFYAADFLADEHVVLMSLAGRGAYITLLCYCWREGSIPSDLTKLGRLCGVDSSAMAQLWSELEACFEKATDRYTHPRLERERVKQEEYKKERSESGKRGAQTRWGAAPEVKKEVARDSSAIAQPSSELLAVNASSSSSSIEYPSGIQKRSHSQSSRSRRSQTCDEDWLKDVQAKPAYKHLDVQRLYSKMVVWCEVKGKQATRSRLINWLNREEPPMTAPVLRNGHNGGYTNKSEQLARQNDAAGNEWLNGSKANQFDYVDGGNGE